MSARWGAEELKTLKLLLAEGVELNLLKQHLSNRSHDALHRQAQKYGYGVKTVDGVRVLYYGKKTRNRKKKADDTSASNETTNKIVGAKKATTNSIAPTTSERTNQNISDVIVADNVQNINRDALKHIYDDISTLLSSEHYQQIASITVTLENTVLTVTRGKL